MCEVEPPAIVLYVYDDIKIQYVYLFSFRFHQVVQPIQIHVAILVPAIILGVLGGLGGAIFTLGNVMLCRFRALWVSKLKHPTVQKFAKMGECVLIVVMLLI